MASKGLGSGTWRGKEILAELLLKPDGWIASQGRGAFWEKKDMIREVWTFAPAVEPPEKGTIVRWRWRSPMKECLP
jgi:hypothetical protein